MLRRFAPRNDNSNWGSTRPTGLLTIYLDQRLFSLPFIRHGSANWEPLPGWKGYAPVARAMAVALDYGDCFAAAHSLASLAVLEEGLARL